MAEPEWLETQKRASVICTNCGRIRPEMLCKIEVVKIRDDLPRTPHAGAIGELNSTTMLGADIIRAVGRETIAQAGSILPVVEPNGKIAETHFCIVENQPTRGLIRGPNATHAALCRECGKVLYWPSWPTSKWYLLKRYWNENHVCNFVGGDLLFSKDTYDIKIAPLRIPKLKGAKVRLVDEPTDGLPSDFDELRAELQRRDAIR